MTPFPELPTSINAEGAPRRTGIEIEFGDIPEDEAAQLCADELGGTPVQNGVVWTVEGSEIGDVDIYLDTALRKTSSDALRKLGLELGREVIPVELVSEPLTTEGLALLDGFCETLREEGAIGTESGWLLGFGVHFNVEIASADNAGIVRPLLAYALIEDWLRNESPIDASRRILPFTAPYPTRFVDALIGLGLDATWQEAMEVYLRETPSRNRGLDMLPIFAWLDGEAVEAKVEDKTSPRPAFHFRLPDCRIDDPDWSLRNGWATWRLVEQIAARPNLLERLALGWRDDHGPITLSRASWAKRTQAILAEAFPKEVPA